ncbi:MAG: hypothetical protein PHE96_01075 [Methylococcales bacterium]|nr:hypothetical protein [Methylococcales bacterium]
MNETTKCNCSNSEAKANDSKRGEEFYSLLRDYIKHEDDLINQRMTWLMSVQSFLIATFGFSYQKKFEIVSKALINKETQALGFSIVEYDLFLIMLIVVGIATSYFALQSIEAATHSITQLRERWRDFYRCEWRKLCDSRPQLDHLPDITGGGVVMAHIQGIKFPFYLPRFFIFFWVGIFFLTLWVTGNDLLNWLNLDHHVIVGFPIIT